MISRPHETELVTCDPFNFAFLKRIVELDLESEILAAEGLDLLDRGGHLLPRAVTVQGALPAENGEVENQRTRAESKQAPPGSDRGRHQHDSRPTDSMPPTKGRRSGRPRTVR